MFMRKRDRLVPEQKPLPARRDIPSSGFPRRDNSSRKSDKLGGRIPVAAQGSSERPLDWDDISLSSEDSKSFKRFFKKGEKEAPRKDKKKISTERPKTSRGASDARVTGRPSTSSALNRFAAIEAKIKDRQDAHMLSLSGSDFALDISSDAEVKRDIGKTDINLRETLKKRKKEPRRNVFLTLDDTSETSEEDASRRNQFLKDATNNTTHDTDSESNHITRTGNKHNPTKRASKAASYGREGHGRESYSKDASKSTSTKKVTFSTELQQASDIDQSLDEFMPPHSDSSDAPISLNDFLHSGIHNVMSLDDLVPSEEIHSQKEDFRPTSALGFVGLHSVEELMPATKEVQSSTEFIPSMQEDIHSDSSDPAPNLMSNVRSLEDLLSSESEKPAQEEKPKPVIEQQKPGVFRSPKIEEESEVEEIVSESPNYSEDFHSDETDDDTLKDTESIAQDMPDDPIISTSISTKLSDAQEEKSSYSSYSSLSSSPSSSTITTDSSTPRIRKPKRTTVTTETQTDAAGKPWIPGLSFVDSAYFKPTRLVQGEILDVLSAQNPAAVALHDLLKQQLDLTREFITKAKVLHDRAVGSIPKDYIYGQIDEARLERLKRIWYDDYLD